MKKHNRDLLVLLNESSSPVSLNKELESLHILLNPVEKLENIIISHEVINVNKYKVYTDKKTVIKTIVSKKTKAFVFLNNLN